MVHRLQHEARRHQSFRARDDRGADRADRRLPAKPGAPVYNGEWGPQDGGALDSRVRLVTAVREQCESAGVGWAIWEDPVNMNLFDSRAGTWLTEIVDALLPP